MLRKILSLLGIIAVSSCSSDSSSKKSNDNTNLNSAFQFKIYSDYGTKNTLDTDNPSEDLIIKWMDKLDWTGGFHQVSLHKDKSNWFEVGGSLDPSDGLSGIVCIEGEQFVTPTAPVSLSEIKNLILSYYNQDSSWRSSFSIP